MIISKQSVLDTIEIAKLIAKNKIENVRLGGKRDPKSQTYHNNIVPKISAFGTKYKSNPQIILKKFLDNYIINNELGDDFEASAHAFFGQILNSYAWACIINKHDPDKLLKFMRSPQLYILVNKRGIKFGFCYGNSVKPDHKSVEIVKTAKSMQQNVANTLINDNTLNWYSKSIAQNLPARKDRLSITSSVNVASNWSNNIHLIKSYPVSNIPNDIEKQIEDTFGELLTIFKAVSNLELVEPIKEHQTWGSVKKELDCGFDDSTFDINQLYFEDKAKGDLIRQIITALKNGKNIILIGPPGTGKSKLAKEICEHYRKPGDFSMATATSDWSTFETIGGYRPVQGGALQFFPGIFLQCFKNREGKPINKWLIIDELNRADIDKAFGSLFSALTGDDVTLPFEIGGNRIEIVGNPQDDMEIQDYRFVVHPHWRIIATMNTYDKSSLYEMSYAFMRRLAFIPVEVPTQINRELIEKYANIWKLDINTDICTNLVELWRVINKFRKIGPSIIEDIYRYVKDTSPPDYGSAVIMYVLPQFEGLMEQPAVNFVKETVGLSFVTNEDELKRFAAEFFNIDEAKFQT